MSNGPQDERDNAETSEVTEQPKPHQKRDPAFPSMYALLYQLLRPTARECGYALALHGSMARDLDIIAVAWTEDAAPAEALIDALAERVDAFIVRDPAIEKNPVEKPHGRLAWVLHLVGTGGYIDLSVIPPSKERR